jgi:hypothetical protein
MSIAWFIAKYKRTVGRLVPGRYCVMDDYTSLIFGDGGNWVESEILGNRAVVKVRANTSTLTTIAADPLIVRLPLSLLDDPLSSLTANQRTAIRNQILDMGYTAAEVNNAFPNIANATLGQVLRFAATRKLQPRYDAPTDTIICDGDVEGCTSIDLVDAMVQ